MRVFACIDAPGNDLTTTREVPISVHLRGPVPAGRGSAAKVLPLCLPLSLLLPLLLPLLVAKGQELRAGLLLFALASCSATKMPAATLPLPVNFLTIRHLSGRADIGAKFLSASILPLYFLAFTCPGLPVGQRRPIPAGRGSACISAISGKGFAVAVAVNFG